MSLLALPMMAVPARRIPYVVTQPDGTKLTLMKVGDEHFDCVVTSEGIVVEKDSTTGWYRAVDERLVKERIETARVRRQEVNMRRWERSAPARRSLQKTEASSASLGKRCPYEGKKKGLVILVDFKDVKMKSSCEDFSDMFNKEGYNKNGHIGSVRDYFKEQSYGKLIIDFDVVGPVTVSKEMRYYGQNSVKQKDVHASQMIVEAVKLADPQVNYADYDWDGDGWVDQVYVIYAGYGEAAQGSDENTIWPHEYDLYSAWYYNNSEPGYQYLDNVGINTYACSSELEGTSGVTVCGIGTACHEFSHCLGFPDFYDVNYTFTPSMLDWDILDGGSYNGPNYNGEVPTGMSAYERWIGGWLEWNVLENGCNVENMPNLGDEPCAYIIYNEGAKQEAYILENRQNKRWFSYPKDAHGMLIYHVDYDESVWHNNEVNTDISHPRMSVVPANNTYGEKYYNSSEKTGGQYNPTLDELRGMLWPGTKKKTSFTNTTTPAAKTFNRNTDGSYKLNAPVESIKESSDGKISFVFKGGYQLDTPTLKLANYNDENQSVKLVWNEIPGATEYVLNVACRDLQTKEQLALSESMSGLTTSTDGSKDVASALDSKMSLKGWTGQRVFEGKYGARLGSGVGAGYLQTPAIVAEGIVKVTLTLTRYGTDNTAVTVKLVDLNTNNELDSQTLEANGEEQTVSLNGAKGNCALRVTPQKRAYLRDLNIYTLDGKVEEKQMTLRGCSAEVPVDGNHTYTFKVKACNTSAVSDWSNELPFEISVDTGVELTPDKRDACGAAGMGYDLLGRRVNSKEASAFPSLNNQKFLIINNHLILKKQ